MKKAKKGAAGDNRAVPGVHSAGTFAKQHAVGKTPRETCPRDGHSA